MDFSRADKYIILIFSILATSLVFCSLPIFSLRGMYEQVDTQIIFLQLFCSSIFLYNAVKISILKKISINTFNPVNLIPFLLGFVSVIASIFNSNLTFSLSGSPQIGQGAFWYFGLAILSITFTGYYYSKKERVLVFSFLLVVTIFVSFFTINPFWKGLPVSFFYFADYLCFFGIIIFIILTTITKNFIIISIAYIFLGAYFLLIDNNTAKVVWISTLVGGAFYFMLIKLEKIKFLKNLKFFLFSNYMLTLYIIIISFLIVASSLIFWPGYEKLPKEIADSAIGSLVVRGKIAEVALYSLGSPKQFLLGSGWGSIPEVLLSNMTSWQFDQLRVGFNLHFHTHNEFFEHLVSLGLVGGILFILYVYFIFKLTENQNIFTRLAWLLFFKLSCFWFIWAATLPLMALAIGFTVKNIRKPNFNSYFTKFFSNNEVFLRKTILTVYISLSIFLIYGASLTYKSVEVYQKISYQNLLGFVSNNTDYRKVCSNFYNDQNRGGYYLIPFLDYYTSYYLLESDKREVDSDKVLDMVNCIADNLIFSDKALPSLVTTSLGVQAKSYLRSKKNLSIDDKFSNHFLKNNYEKWYQKALIADSKLPKRDDFLLPFLAFAVETQNIDDAVNLCMKRKRQRIEAYCNLLQAYKILEKDKISSIDLEKSIIYIKKAISTGILNEKIYGWWYEREFIELDLGGFSGQGFPLAQDRVFLVSSEEARKLLDLVENY